MVQPDQQFASHATDHQHQQQHRYHGIQWHRTSTITATNSWQWN